MTDSASGSEDARLDSRGDGATRGRLGRPPLVVVAEEFPPQIQNQPLQHPPLHRRSRVLAVAVACLAALAAHSLMAAFELLASSSQRPRPFSTEGPESPSSEGAAGSGDWVPRPTESPTQTRGRVRGLAVHDLLRRDNAQGALGGDPFGGDAVSFVGLRIELSAAVALVAQAFGALAGAAVADGVPGRVSALKSGLALLAPSACLAAASAAAGGIFGGPGEGLRRENKLLLNADADEGDAQEQEDEQAGGERSRQERRRSGNWLGLRVSEVSAVAPAVFAVSLALAAFASGWSLVPCFCLCFEEPDAHAGTATESDRLFLANAAPRKGVRGHLASSDSNARNASSASQQLKDKQTRPVPAAASPRPLASQQQTASPPRFSWNAVRPFVLLMATENAARLSVHLAALLALLRRAASDVDSEGVFETTLPPSLFFSGGLAVLALGLVFVVLKENPFVLAQKQRAVSRLSRAAEISPREKASLLLRKHRLQQQRRKSGEKEARRHREEALALRDAAMGDDASCQAAAAALCEGLSGERPFSDSEDEDLARPQKSPRDSVSETFVLAFNEEAAAEAGAAAQTVSSRRRWWWRGGGCLQEARSSVFVTRRLGLPRKKLLYGLVIPAALIASALWARGVSRTLLLEDAVAKVVSVKGRRAAALQLQRLEALLAALALGTSALPLLAGKYIPPKPLQLAACVVAAFVAFGFAVSLHTLGATFPQEPPIDSSVSASFLYEVAAQTPDFAPALTCVFLALQTTHTAVRALTVAASFAAAKTAGALSLLASDFFSRRCCAEAGPRFPACAAQTRALFSCFCYVAAAVCTLAHTPHVRLRRSGGDGAAALDGEERARARERERESRDSPRTAEREKRSADSSSARSAAPTAAAAATALAAESLERESCRLRSDARFEVRERGAESRRQRESARRWSASETSSAREQLNEQGRRVLLEHGFLAGDDLGAEKTEGKQTKGLGMVSVLDALHWGERQERLSSS